MAKAAKSKDSFVFGSRAREKNRKGRSKRNWDRNEEEKQIADFINRRGATQCPAGRAAGILESKSLGLDV